MAQEVGSMRSVIVFKTPTSTITNGATRLLTPISPPLTDERSASVTKTNATKFWKSQNSSVVIETIETLTPKNRADKYPHPLTPPDDSLTETQTPNPYYTINRLSGGEDSDVVCSSSTYSCLKVLRNPIPLPGSWAKCPSLIIHKKEGFVTFSSTKSNYGIIDCKVFFELSVVMGGQAERGSAVYYEALRIPERMFEWNAYKVIIIPNNSSVRRKRHAACSDSYVTEAKSTRNCQSAQSNPTS